MKKFTTGLLYILITSFSLSSATQITDNAVHPATPELSQISLESKNTSTPKTRWSWGKRIKIGIGATLASLYILYLGVSKKRALEISWANQLANAIKDGNLMKVKELIEVEHFDPENRSETNATAIIIAAQAKQPSIVTYLVKDKHVNMNVEDKKELTALDHAIINGDISMVRTLIGLGADVNKQDQNKRSYLEEAVLRNQPEIVAILLKYNANPNWHSKTTSPLLYAADHNYIDMVKQLLHYGAKDDTRSYPFDETAYDKAHNNGNLEIMTLLANAQRDL